ncbi:MAG TPA: copper resistance CopC family protein, partial [Chloroflexota bacterium]
MTTRRPLLPATPLRRLILLATVALCIAVFACSSIASAHANLVNSDPPENAVIASTPSELRLWFSEAPEPVFSEVRLLDASGQPVQGLGSL